MEWYPTLWVTDFKGNNPRYIYYFLKTLHLENYDSGGANPTLNRNHIHDLQISYPNREIQDRIADILSAYDDLIENNNRRIALLEEAMHILYREWFVRMRFPGYEHVHMVDGLPEGWEETVIDQAFKVLGGGTPSKEINDYWQDGMINWYTPTDLTKAQAMFADASISKITETGLVNSSAKMFPPNSVMMTSRATIGAIAINTTEACTNQGFITCLPNMRVPLFFLFHWLKNNQ
jgi:type I restriction enzyme S subunit